MSFLFNFTEMFEHPAMIVILSTTTIFTVVTLALLVESVHHVAKHVPRSGVANHRINTVWMLALYPVKHFETLFTHLFS